MPPAWFVWLSGAATILNFLIQLGRWFLGREIHPLGPEQDTQKGN